jgi:hypothetical protein
VHGDSSAESRFTNQLNSSFIIISKGIGEMVHRKAEAIFQLFFAREDFFLGLIPRKKGKSRMSTGVGANLMTCRQPLANLRLVH